jgi:hypothetical protein
MSQLSVPHFADETAAREYFSIYKRCFKGVYQHFGKKHLQRYLAEYDFRYNNLSPFGIEDERRTNITSLRVKAGA